MRSKEDWQVFRKQQKAIEENTLVEWAIEEDEDTDEEDTDTLSEEQPKTAGRKADTRTLPELLIERHDILIERIGTRLKTPCYGNRYSTAVYRTGGIPLHAEVSHQDFQKRTARAIQ